LTQFYTHVCSPKFLIDSGVSFDQFLLTIINRFFVENIICFKFISLYLHVTQLKVIAYEVKDFFRKTAFKLAGQHV